MGRAEDGFNLLQAANTQEPSTTEPNGPNMESFTAAADDAISSKDSSPIETNFNYTDYIDEQYEPESF